MADPVRWISKAPKPCAEVMAARRMSCPRLTVGEDAVEHGIVRRETRAGDVPIVAVTEKGLRAAGCRCKSSAS